MIIQFSLTWMMKSNTYKNLLFLLVPPLNSSSQKIIIIIIIIIIILKKMICLPLKRFFECYEAKWH